MIMLEQILTFGGTLLIIAAIVLLLKFLSPARVSRLKGRKKVDDK